MDQYSMKETLTQRWHASTDRLANALLYSQTSHSEASKSSSGGLDGTNVTVTTLSNKWLGKVASLYDEPHRAYHNLSHVEDVISSLDVLMERSSSGGGTQPTPPLHTEPSEDDVAVATLAAFFHDVIYDPKSSTNERDSANLFHDFASELSERIAASSKSLGNDSDVDRGKDGTSSTKITKSTRQSEIQMTTRIEECIVATATHIASAIQARANHDNLLAVFLDADMSILGRDADMYDRYAGRIRKEYKFVPRDVYCERRAEILESFLPVMDAKLEDSVAGVTPNDAVDRTNVSQSELSRGEEKRHSYIYATERGRELWEDQARRNLMREADALRRGVIPAEEEDM